MPRVAAFAGRDLYFLEKRPRVFKEPGIEEVIANFIKANQRAGLQTMMQLGSDSGGGATTREPLRAKSLTGQKIVQPAGAVLGKYEIMMAILAGGSA